MARRGKAKCWTWAEAEADWRLETETETETQTTETGQAEWSDMERETDTRRWAGLRRAGEPNEPLPGWQVKLATRQLPRRHYSRLVLAEFHRWSWSFSGPLDLDVDVDFTSTCISC